MKKTKIEIAPIDREAEAAARARQAQLTKPAGALGRLEEIACWLAGRQGREIPRPLVPHIMVFAADHGVAAQGVSAYPPEVTAEMVRNFARGGAAINVLARAIGAEVTVVDVGVAAELGDLPAIVHAKVRPGSRDLSRGAALSPEEWEQAVAVGRRVAATAIDAGATLLLPGDMGIGNTTPSACLICHLTGAPPEAVVGRGTGIDDATRARKVAVVAAAVDRAATLSGVAAMAAVGGLEIGAIAGCFLEAAARGIPAVVDGFIAAAGGLAAAAVAPGVEEWLLASHRSQERGHAIALERLALTPLVDLGLRLGEGSGAALIVPLLQAAVALHAEMATFAEAGVSGANE